MLGDRKFLVLITAVIIAGCASSIESEPAPSAEKSAALSASSWTSPNGDPIGIATPTNPVKTIDTKAAVSALSDPAMLAELRSRALKAASLAGVASPKTINVVAASDHQEVESILSGATIDDHAPVYVITITGGPFTSRRRPPDAPAPQGKVLTLTIDAATHRLTDVGFVDVVPDLSKIGSPIDLTP